VESKGNFWRWLAGLLVLSALFWFAVALQSGDAAGVALKAVC
jgi:hypothetical protein